MRLFTQFTIMMIGTTLVWGQADKDVEVIQETVDGVQVMRHTVIVEAELEAVWALFTTSEGCTSWITPVAYIDFREGGIGETSYKPDAKSGDPENIVVRYSNILPLKHYESKLIKAPENNPFESVLLALKSSVTFEDLGSGRVKVTISMIGWNDSEEHKKVRTFFESGNTWYCHRLIKRCKEGPLPWQGIN